MAAADRVSAIRVLAAGDFGRDVAARISRAAPVAGVPQLVVVAAWRPMPRLFERVDALAFRRGFSWLPVVHADPELRVGPLVVPGAGPCLRCFVRRSRQHSPNAAEDAAVDAAYDAGVSLGARGYLPAVAGLGAALALDVWRRSPREAAGRVTCVDFVRSASWVATVIGVHGCPRCGEQPLG